ANVGSLCGQHDGHEQLQRILEIEFTTGIGVGFVQSALHASCPADQAEAGLFTGRAATAGPGCLLIRNTHSGAFTCCWGHPASLRNYEFSARTGGDTSLMTVWLVLCVPLLVMVFAWFMERVETRLRHLNVQEEDVEEFLEQAEPDEVRALYGHGIGRALELFSVRRRRARRGANNGSNGKAGRRA